MIALVKRGATTLLATALALCATAQSNVPDVTAHVEPDSILIGDRFTLTIEVEADRMQEIIFPQFTQKSDEEGEAESDDERPNEPKGSLECITDHPADTVQSDGRRLRLAKRYTMTAFDEGIYSLGRPQVLYLDKNIVDTLFSRNELRVVVNPVIIDSTATSIREYKPQKHLPFHIYEILDYLLWGLAVVAVLALAFWALYRYLKSRGKRISDLFRPTPPPPPHIVAIAALEALHHQKLWQNNKHKLYYSALSDILRTYLDGRFDIGAMEMTTDKIIDEVRRLDIPQKSAMDLIGVLRDADLVKFAKAMPEADENESNYHKAYYFVEETKPFEPQPDDEDDEAPKTENER